MRHLALLSILLIALILRVFLLDKLPIGFTADEASFGYDAYSILKTGKDAWGAGFPLALRSFGDFKLPLYTYLAIPTVAIFGLNELAVRLPGAVLGILAILSTYFLVKELFKDKKLALLSALMLTISPWHLSLSRGAFEANLTTFFLTSGILFFLKGLEKRLFLIPSALLLGLNLFSYHSARLITPLFVLILVLLNWKKLIPKPRSLILPIIILGTFTFLAFFTLLKGGGSRSADVAIFNPTDNWQAVSQERYESIELGMPSPIARLFSNKVTYTLKQFTQNYLTYVSPNFLFLQGAGEGTYGMLPGMGVLYIAELAFLIAAFAKLLKEKDKKIGLVLGWIFLGLIPASLSKGSGYAANRAAIIMPALQIFSAYGLLALAEILGKLKIPKGAIQISLLSLLVLSLLGFLKIYVYNAPNQMASSMNYGWKATMDFVGKRQDNYREIIISRRFSEPQIFVEFYLKVDPSLVQKESQDWLRYAEKKLPFLDQLGEYKLGKYTISDLNYREKEGLENTLLIGKPEDFPEGVKPVFSVNPAFGKPLIWVVEGK
jgi:4-amino-4-deoxy-L-arabinose transferase-like glycosyltransferase